MVRRLPDLPRLLAVLWRMGRGKLTFLSFNVTNRCTERCPMCAVWRTPCQELSLAEIAAILGGLADYGIRVVELAGGEPFLRPDLFEILALCDRLGLLCTLTTNGTVLDDEHIARLGQVGNALQLAVSLDSLDPERYALLRGRDCLPAVLASLERLARARLPMPVKVNFTLSRLNHQEVPAVLHFVKARGLFLSVFPVNSGQGFAHRHDAPLFAASNEERRAMATRFRDLARLRRAGHPLWEYSRFYELAAAYVEGRQRGECDAGRLYLDLRADGTLAPCLDQPGFADLRTEKIAAVLPRLATRQGAIQRCASQTPCCYTCTQNISITARHLWGYLLETTRLRGLWTPRPAR